jgi:hypothetical protein
VHFQPVDICVNTRDIRLAGEVKPHENFTPAITGGIRTFHAAKTFTDRELPLRCTPENIRSGASKAKAALG